MLKRNRIRLLKKKNNSGLKPHCTLLPASGFLDEEEKQGSSLVILGVTRLGAPTFPSFWR